MSHRISGRWATAVVEGVVLAGLAAMLAVVLLPTARRSIERARGLEKAAFPRVAPEVSVKLPSALGSSQLTKRVDTAPIPDAPSICETVCGAATAAVAAAEAGEVPTSGQRDDVRLPDLVSLMPEPVSWASVGGCGVGGSGTGGNVRWIGRRVPGGRIETELMATYSSGEDLETAKMNLKVTTELPGRFNVGFSIPYLYSERWDTDYELLISEHRPLRVHDFGDLNLLVSRKFGIASNIVANLTIGIPTAPYDVTQDAWHVPVDAQPGRGKMTASLGLDYIIDKNYGPMIVGGSYNYSGGENDVGDFKSDSISLYCFASYRTEKMVHSLGGTLTNAFEEDRNLGAALADQPLLLFTLQYGLEFSFPRFPLYFATTGTFSENGVDAFGVSLGVMTAF